MGNQNLSLELKKIDQSGEENVAELEVRAEEVARALLSVKPNQHDQRQESRVSIDQLGYGLQKEAMRQSELLKSPLTDLSNRGGDGGQVAQSLIQLKMEVENLDPGKLDFEPGWFSRLVGKLPGVGTPMKRYFTKFESAQTVISAILKSLEQGKSQLERDNITLNSDQKQMRDLTYKLESSIQFGKILDQKLQTALDQEVDRTSEKYSFVAEELLFPLRQRLLDLQQQLAVNQQGVLAIDLIIRNNQELARGVDRALHVTVSALHVGVTVALALENQKIVLDKIESVGKTTSDLIAGTAKRLKTQGAQIQQRASAPILNIEALKSAFGDLNGALQDIGRFRQEALPKMAQQVLELDQITSKAKRTLEQHEKGKANPILLT